MTNEENKPKTRKSFVRVFSSRSGASVSRMGPNDFCKDNCNERDWDKADKLEVGSSYVEAGCGSCIVVVVRVPDVEVD